MGEGGCVSTHSWIVRSYQRYGRPFTPKCWQEKGFSSSGVQLHSDEQETFSVRNVVVLCILNEKH